MSKPTNDGHREGMLSAYRLAAGVFLTAIAHDIELMQRVSNHLQVQADTLLELPNQSEYFRKGVTEAMESMFASLPDPKNRL